MRFGSIVFWTGFVGFLALSVIGYKHYMQGSRKQAHNLNKATNAMGTLKRDSGELRGNYDSVLGMDAGKVGGGATGVSGAGTSAGLRQNAGKSIQAVNSRHETQVRHEDTARHQAPGRHEDTARHQAPGRHEAPTRHAKPQR